MSKTEEDYYTVMDRVRPIVAEVFRDQDGTPWVAVKRNGATVNMSLYSEDFDELVIAASMAPGRYGFGDSGLSMPCSPSVIKAVRSALRLLAHNNQRGLFLRYAWENGKLFTDIGDAGHTVFETDKKGLGRPPL